MAPDRGSEADSGGSGHPQSTQSRHSNAASPPPIADEVEQPSDAQEPWGSHSELGKFLAEDAVEGRNFTVRSIIIGLLVGILICFSNTFFGLQTGWISGMTMPASLIGFAFFKTFAKHLSYPFSPVENVLVQTVATSVGTMPLGSGFVGVIPALEYLLTPEENGPIKLGLGRLVIWSLGLSFFGVVFGVPLRKQVIIREELKFPSGTATALMIGVLHGGGEKGGNRENVPEEGAARRNGGASDQAPLISRRSTEAQQTSSLSRGNSEIEEATKARKANNWKLQIRLLVVLFLVSGLYTLITYFVPQLRHIPFLGTYLASTWLWTFNLSPAYAAQGIIMGPATTCHMFIGAIVGWGVLSPLAKQRGWAPGPVKDWEHGSKGWIVWVSLAIMLADSIISLGWLAAKPLLSMMRSYIQPIWQGVNRKGWKGLVSAVQSKGGYTALVNAPEESAHLSLDHAGSSQEDEHDLDLSRSRTSMTSKPPARKGPKYKDAPADQLIDNRTVVIGLVAALLFCIVSIRISFGALVPIYATIMAVIMALLLSIMGVRALGQTDLNPVSGISKLTQLVFAVIIPRSNRNAVLINLVGGAVSEAGALQAGDMLQDLKTGHLLAASPKAQFHGQLIGSFVGAIASAAVYKLYTSVYPVPGDLFPVPTGYVWIFTARLVTGQGLPPMAWEYALGAALVFSLSSCVRIAASNRRWKDYIPGGIAVAVGMYNVPSFTLARVVGGLINWYWLSYRTRKSLNRTHARATTDNHRRHPDHTVNDDPIINSHSNDRSDDDAVNELKDIDDKKDQDQNETLLIVLASGLILGEGVVSIVNLVLASAGVGHL